MTYSRTLVFVALTLAAGIALMSIAVGKAGGVAIAADKMNAFTIGSDRTGTFRTLALALIERTSEPVPLDIARRLEPAGAFQGPPSSDARFDSCILSLAALGAANLNESNDKHIYFVLTRAVRGKCDVDIYRIARWYVANPSGDISRRIDLAVLLIFSLDLCFLDARDGTPFDLCCIVEQAQPKDPQAIRLSMCKVVLGGYESQANQAAVLLLLDRLLSEFAEHCGHESEEYMDLLAFRGMLRGVVAGEHYLADP